MKLSSELHSINPYFKSILC